LTPFRGSYGDTMLIPQNCCNRYADPLSLIGMQRVVL
jgi:hypothetical protein